MINKRERILNGVLFLAFVMTFCLSLDWIGGTQINAQRVAHHILASLPAAFVLDWMTLRRNRRELEAKQNATI